MKIQSDPRCQDLDRDLLRLRDRDRLLLSADLRRSRRLGVPAGPPYRRQTCRAQRPGPNEGSNHSVRSRLGHFDLRGDREIDRRLYLGDLDRDLLLRRSDLLRLLDREREREYDRLLDNEKKQFN